MENDEVSYLVKKTEKKKERIIKWIKLVIARLINFYHIKKR